MLSLHLIKILEVWISGLSRDLKYKRAPDTAVDLSSGQIYCRDDWHLRLWLYDNGRLLNEGWTTWIMKDGTKSCPTWEDPSRSSMAWIAMVIYLQVDKAPSTWARGGLTTTKLWWQLLSSWPKTARFSRDWIWGSCWNWSNTEYLLSHN